MFTRLCAFFVTFFDQGSELLVFFVHQLWFVVCSQSINKRSWLPFCCDETTERKNYSADAEEIRMENNAACFCATRLQARAVCMFFQREIKFQPKLEKEGIMKDGSGPAQVSLRREEPC
jgi:hypothetical protein